MVEVVYEDTKWSRIAKKVDRVGKEIEQVKRTAKYVRNLPFFPPKGQPGGLYVNGKPAPFEKWDEK
jgi:hypothetical protein